MWWHQWIVLLYTSLNTAVISHKPLKNVFSIYSNSDRIDLIYLGWGKTPPRSILGGICFWIGGGVEPLHTYLLPPLRNRSTGTGVGDRVEQRPWGGAETCTDVPAHHCCCSSARGKAVVRWHSGALIFDI